MTVNLVKNLDGWLNTTQVAQILGVSVSVLKKWRYQGVGPSYSKAGRAVRYRPSDIEAWMNARTVETAA